MPVKQILMGGGASSGSSLLRNILGRHSDIFASQETNIFAKWDVYHDWTKTQRRLMWNRFLGLRDFGFSAHPGIHIYPRELRFDRGELAGRLRKSEHIRDFGSRMFSDALEYYGKSIWLEKTPSNAYLFDSFLGAFPNGRIIHTVRHPLDTIASLMARGYTAFFAAGLYLLNNASALSMSQSNRYQAIRYVDVVLRPSQTIQALCHWLDLTYEDTMMIPHQEDHIDITTIDGWKYDETEAIGSRSVGRYDELTQEDKGLILQAIHFIRISDWGRAYYGIENRSIGEMAPLWGYDIPDADPDPQQVNILRRQMRRDQIRRTIRALPYGLGRYPLVVRY